MKQLSLHHRPTPMSIAAAGITRPFCVTIPKQDSRLKTFPPKMIGSSFLTAKAKAKGSTPPSSMEVVSLMSYTSLKDLLPGISSASSKSLEDIPIKNQLVKKAALAYLQPLSPSKRHDLGFFGCFEPLKHIISNTFKLFFIDKLTGGRVDAGCFPLRQLGCESNTV